MLPIRIMIADDHALLRQGIKKVLELEDDLTVIAEASDGEETIRKVAEVEPDILLLDINMPKLNGLGVAKALKAEESKTKIIILSIHDDEHYVLEVIKSGAAGYLLKDIEPGMLVNAIRTVFGGEPFIYPTLAKRLFSELNRLDKSKRYEMVRNARGSSERLTAREIEVLQLIGQGLSNHDMAQRLYLSEKTVKNHLTNIFRKINVADRTQAVLYAIRHKIVHLE